MFSFCITLVIVSVLYVQKCSCLSKTYYVSSESSECDILHSECSTDHPCTLFCPFKLEEVKKYDEVTVRLFPGMYNLSHPKYQGDIMRRKTEVEEDCDLFVYLASFSVEQVIIIESVGESPENTVIANYPIFSGEWTWFDCYLVEYGLFFIEKNVEVLSVTFKNLTISKTSPPEVLLHGYEDKMYIDQYLILGENEIAVDDCRDTRLSFNFENVFIKDVMRVVGRSNFRKLSIRHSQFENVECIGEMYVSSEKYDEEEDYLWEIYNSSFRGTYNNPFASRDILSDSSPGVVYISDKCKSFYETDSSPKSDNEIGFSLKIDGVRFENFGFAPSDAYFEPHSIIVVDLESSNSNPNLVIKNSLFNDISPVGGVDSIFVVHSFNSSISISNCEFSSIVLFDTMCHFNFFSEFHLLSIVDSVFHDIVTESDYTQGNLVQIEIGLSSRDSNREDFSLVFRGCSFERITLNTIGASVLAIRIFSVFYEKGHYGVTEITGCSFQSIDGWVGEDTGLYAINFLSEIHYYEWAVRGNDDTLLNMKIDKSRFVDVNGVGVNVNGVFDLVVEDCEFIRNRKSAMRIIDNKFALDTSTGISCNYVIQNCVFRDNVGEDGGAIYLQSECDYTEPKCGIFDSYFEGNRAVNGGAIFFTKGNSESGMYVLRLCNLTAKHNRADYGGAIFLDLRSQICVVGWVEWMNKTRQWHGGYVSSVFESNSAQTGGAIYANAAWSFVFVDTTELNCSVHPFDYLIFENNFVSESDDDSATKIYGVGYQTAPLEVDNVRKKPNECRKFIGKNNWKCDLSTLVIVDYYRSEYKSPTFEEHLIQFEITQKGDKTIPILLSSKHRNVSPKSQEIIFFAEYNSFERNLVPASVTFMGKTIQTEIHLVKTWGSTVPLKDVIAIVVSLVVLGVCIVSLLTFCFCCCFCCCCLANIFVIHTVRSIRRHQIQRMEVAMREFENYPDIINSSTSMRSSGDDSDENSVLLGGYSVRKLGVCHVIFYSDESEVGTVYYVEEGTGFLFLFPSTRYYPVFSGKFSRGKKKGEGIEFYYNSEIYSKNPLVFHPRDFRAKFKGSYDEDHRNGHGTEYKNEEGSGVRLMGTWVHGRLVKIFTIDFPLEVFEMGDVNVVKRIGKGGFSRIFKVVYKNEEVALKNFGDDDDTTTSDTTSSINNVTDRTVDLYGVRRAFRRKENYANSERIGGILKRIRMFNHPNIVNIVAWTGPKFLKDEFAYLMELCECSVRELYFKNKGFLDLVVKDKILLECARGMECFHDHCGFIHRDLKLDNLLVDSLNPVSMTVKICDFNLGLKGFDEDGLLRCEIAGSPFHCSPETFLHSNHYSFTVEKNQKEDEQSSLNYGTDIYSFGIMMFELYFDRVGDPFQILKSRKCPVCQEYMDCSSSRELAMEMKKHHSLHGESFRPSMTRHESEEEECEGEEDDDGYHLRGSNKHSWRVELMKRCWSQEVSRRPSFRDVVGVYNRQMK